MDYAIIYCLDNGIEKAVTIDKSFLKTAKKIEGYWEVLPNPYYPEEEPYPTTIGTVHKEQFIDMKRVVVGLQSID